MKNISKAYLVIVILMLCASKVLNHEENKEHTNAIVQPLTNEMTITFIPEGE
tara:strand:- start:4547 stop:4702 length:156 start_codon:yes stop_codon:yes gene_type:complete